jgi:hypothetical protein
MYPISSTGKAKISSVLVPLPDVVAATNEDMSQSFMKSWQAHPQSELDTQDPDARGSIAESLGEPPEWHERT